jgi:hypothetical protein
MDQWSSAKLCDVANLLLGSSLFFSPWLFGLSAGAQTTIGLFIAVLAVAALAAFAVWEEWFSLIAGLWLIGLPWLLGFEDSDTITICVVTGTIVAALAAFKVWLVHYRDQRITLSHQQPSVLWDRPLRRPGLSSATPERCEQGLTSGFPKPIMACRVSSTIDAD